MEERHKGGATKGDAQRESEALADWRHWCDERQRDKQLDRRHERSAMRGGGTMRGGGAGRQEVAV